MRPSRASFTGETVEHVNIRIGEVEVIHRASQSAYVGVVTVHTKLEKYVFVYGPKNPDETWHYDFHHRREVIVESSKVSNLDAMDITAPHAPGVLCGGSHIHVFSPNGERVSFTYNDHIMHEFDPALDLRNVGVATSSGPVNVQRQHPREYSGSHWYVLVGETMPTPQPDSDEINRTYEEGWIGNHALALIDGTLPVKGGKVSELFIVELLQDGASQKAVGNAPLNGTGTTLPTPPYGVIQRRLTFTHHWAYPELTNVPRHWARYDPQSTRIAFLMRDDNGIMQLWLISPQGGEPRQLTHDKADTQPVSNWHPSGE